MSPSLQIASRVRSILPVLAIASLCLASCGEQKAAEPPAPATPAPGAAAPDPRTSGGRDAPPASIAEPTAPAASAADMRPMKEFWPNGQLKFFNEMRRGADGKWGKNGIGRAYYQNGTLEREGSYRDGVRVGVWTYYNPDGSLNRTENRGG